MRLRQGNQQLARGRRSRMLIRHPNISFIATCVLVYVQVSMQIDEVSIVVGPEVRILRYEYAVSLKK